VEVAPIGEVKLIVNVPVEKLAVTFVGVPGMLLVKPPKSEEFFESISMELAKDWTQRIDSTATLKINLKSSLPLRFNLFITFVLYNHLINTLNKRTKNLMDCSEKSC
jgi:hypothetical protein